MAGGNGAGGSLAGPSDATTRAHASPGPIEAERELGRTAPKPTRIDVLGVGVSTGGPNALAEVVPHLPPDLGIPVLVVQHMPPVFTKSLADGLAKKSMLPVREARDSDPIEPDTVLIAPGGRHMVVRTELDAATGERRRRVGVNDSPRENGCRPSVDVLFRSLAAQYGGNMLAVVMTGMGSDGREGVRAMKRRGCYCLTQTEASCVIYGMPQAVDTAGLSDESVALEHLGSRITEITRKPVK